MSDWFTQNAPAQQIGNWFAKNAPVSAPEQKSVGGFIGNALGSAGNVIGGALHAVAHPIDTAAAVANLADGAAQTYIPGVQKLEELSGTDPAVMAKQRDQAKAFVQSMKDRYGSADAALNTLYHDPVGVLADATSVVDPEFAVGKLAALTGVAAKGGKLAKVTEAASDLQKANPTVAVVKSSLDPSEQAAVDFARQNNIPLDAATATGSGALKRTQNVSGAQLGATKIAANAAAATKQGLEAKGAELLNNAAASSHTPETAGQAVADNLQALAKSQGAQASGHYTALEAAENDPKNIQTVVTGTKQVPTGVVDQNGNPATRTVQETKDVSIPVDLRPTKQALQPLYDTLKQQMPIAQQQASKGLTALQNLLGADDHVSASVAENALGAIKSLQREDISPQNKFILGKAIDATQPVIDAAVAKAGPQAIDALQQGRALTRAKYATQATLDNLRTDEPVRLFGQLTQAKDANINLLRDVASKAPDTMPAVGRAVLEGLLDKALGEAGTAKPATALTEWNKIGPETKKILFQDPALRGNLDNFFTLAKKVSENPNPSGTASTAAAMTAAGLVFAHPALGVPLLIANHGLAKMLYSPKATKALTTSLTIPVGSAAAKAVASERLLHAAGGLAQPVGEATSSTAIGGSGATDPLTVKQLSRITNAPVWHFVSPAAKQAVEDALKAGNNEQALLIANQAAMATARGQ